jgi:hypothetical protein
MSLNKHTSIARKSKRSVMKAVAGKCCSYCTWRRMDVLGLQFFNQSFEINSVIKLYSMIFLYSSTWINLSIWLGSLFS